VKLSPLLIGIASLVPSVATAEMLSVKDASAKFVSNPMAKDKRVVFTADKFYPVEVLERKNGWVKVKDFEGDTAWVASTSLGKQSTVVIDTPSANIREKPATSADVLFKVAHGEVFKVEDHKDNWLKVVDSHGDGGWIRVDKTWGFEDEAKKPDLGKKADEKGEHPSSDANAKTSHEEKAHPEADAKKNENQCVCKPAPEDKQETKVARADLTDKNEKKHEKKTKSQKSEKKAPKKK